MKNLTLPIVIEADADAFFGSCPSLQGCYSQGETHQEAMDNINFSMRDDVVKYVASGLKRNWKMRQEMRSGRYTTRWEELFVVH